MVVDAQPKKMDSQTMPYIGLLTAVQKTYNSQLPPVVSMPAAQKIPRQVNSRAVGLLAVGQRRSRSKSTPARFDVLTQVTTG
jgi:hypothetical protein